MSRSVEPFVKFIWLLIVAFVGNGGNASALLDVGAQSTQKKLDAIEHGTAPRGSTVWFSSTELDSWMKEEAKYWTPQGVRDLRLQLGESIATGFARIDFLKLKQASGEETRVPDANFIGRRTSGQRNCAVCVQTTAGLGWMWSALRSPDSRWRAQGSSS